MSVCTPPDVAHASCVSCVSCTSVGSSSVALLLLRLFSIHVLHHPQTSCLRLRSTVSMTLAAAFEDHVFYTNLHPSPPLLNRVFVLTYDYTVSSHSLMIPPSFVIALTTTKHSRASVLILCKTIDYNGSLTKEGLYR